MKIFYLILSLITTMCAIDMITPIPDNLPYDKTKASLGKKLYMDTSLSKDGKVSCNTCHNIKNYGVDNTSNSIGVDNQLDTPFNTPTTFNSVFNFVQFWNGRAQNLAEQIKGPLFDPKEMGLTPEILLQKINANPDYVKSFGDIYGEISVDNIADAIAEFEKTLITPNSPFDRYLKGDKDAISEKAKRGYEEFKAQGCISCHQGQNIGGNMFQKIGIFQEFPDQSNLGRYEITKKESDKMVFKVPSLRNIAKTAPYYHDGSIPTLDACVQFMAYYQLGKFLNQETVDSIVAFLESLTGEYHDNIQ
ncbi:cytochrome-c peroxidase [Campylobacter aviculae]|uniref:Cytochrome B6 n=1 Tax=Campylobacter aviculae TaxID=2510190 RepID=A0A4U7BQ21_9BACT|nr:cytochrome-c peroxidase [Campylobacter aviculae]TKX31026.1 cytochrome B6 [Campylobacter aviculae]